MPWAASRAWSSAANRIASGLIAIPQAPVSSWPATPRNTLATLAAVALSGYFPRRSVVETLSRSLMTSSTMTVRSSGDVRCLAATDADIDGVGSRTRTDSACAPRLPWTTPNSTRVPPLRVATPWGNASACRNTSAPSSSLRKPKPFSASYHLTLPVGTAHLLLMCRPPTRKRVRRDGARCADHKANRYHHAAPPATRPAGPNVPQPETRMRLVGGLRHTPTRDHPRTRSPLVGVVLERPTTRCQVLVVHRYRRGAERGAGAAVRLHLDGSLRPVAGQLVGGHS